MRTVGVRSVVVLLAGAAVVLLGACSSSTSSSSGAVGDTDGAGQYATNCASCHGSDLGGTEQGPSLLSIVYEPSHHGDDAFRSAIRTGSPQHHWGFGAMPPVEGLSDDEVDTIIAFVRAEQDRQGFEP
jgi:mono/diheme cytochrome c family protein